MNESRLLKGATVALALLICIVTTTAIRIEFLNAKAGGLLPVREFRSDTGKSVKWR